MTGVQRARKYVRSACQRCRRQKLKCDVHRPCMLCSRAGVECVAADTETSTRSNAGRTKNNVPSATQQADQSSRTNGDSLPHDQTRHSATPVLTRSGVVEHGLTKTTRPSSSDEARWHRYKGVESESSATMALVETAFLFHGSYIPSTTTSPSLPQSPETPNPLSVNNLRDYWTRSPKPRNIRLYDRLMSALPDRDVTELLVNTYFDYVHWFTLLFHQQDFRQKLKQFYEDQLHGTTHTDTVGFLSTLLIVAFIGLQYLGSYRQDLLERRGVRWKELETHIESILEDSFFAIVSLGTFEAAQSCVLLGTLYLSRGDAAAAWPICGSALRIAQALNLHRKWPTQGTGSAKASQEVLHQIEARKRCWWAVYEFETFCCMLYGYNVHIGDSVCDVDLLDPTSHTTDSIMEESSVPKAKLLVYKRMMSKLSIIIKATLHDLYSSSGQTSNTKETNVSTRAHLPQLVSKVNYLEQRLQQWQLELPVELRISSPGGSGYHITEEYDEDIGGFGTIFDQQILQLQALALKFAYENARVLVHRPLLSYQVRASLERYDQGNFSETSSEPPSDPIQNSLRICHEAGLHISELGALPAFEFVTRTYAASFMGAYLFTAGIALCLNASIEPLSEQAIAAKLGLRRLIQMQRRYSTEALPSVHATDILQKLTTLLLEKELASIIGITKPVYRDIGQAPRECMELQPARSHTKMSVQHDILSHSPSNLLPRSLTTPTSNVGLPSTQHMNESSMDLSLDYPSDQDPVMSETFGGFDSTDMPDLVDPTQIQYLLSPDSTFPFDSALLQDQEQAWIWNTYRG